MLLFYNSNVLGLYKRDKRVAYLSSPFGECNLIGNLIMISISVGAIFIQSINCFKQSLN